MKLSVKLTTGEKILGWVMMALHILVLPLFLALVVLIFSLPVDEGQLNIYTFIIGFILTVIFFFRFLWQNFKTFEKDLKGSLYAALGGYGITILLNIVVNIAITNLAPDFVNVNDESLGLIMQQYYWPMFLCVVILVPITEEMVYRGVLFGILHKKSRVLAYTVTIVVFSAIHMVGYIGTAAPRDLIIGFFQYIPATVGLCYAYEKSDSLWSAVLVHMFNNLLAMLVM